MSGKGAGKKRNRAAQSDQHGYQERPGDIAGKQDGAGGINRDKQSSGKQRILEKLRDLEKRRREKGGGQSSSER